MPVRYAWTGIGSLASVQFHHGAPFHLSAPDAFLNQNDLAAFMDMPFGPGARIEMDMGNAGFRVVFYPLDGAGKVGLLFLLGVYEPEAGSHQEQTYVEQAKETAEAGFSGHIDGHRNTSMDGSASDVAFVVLKDGTEGGPFGVGSGPVFFYAILTVGEGQGLGSFCDLRFGRERRHSLHEDRGKRGGGVCLQGFEFTE